MLAGLVHVITSLPIKKATRGLGKGKFGFKIDFLTLLREFFIIGIELLYNVVLVSVPKRWVQYNATLRMQEMLAPLFCKGIHDTISNGTDHGGMSDLQERW